MTKTKDVDITDEVDFVPFCSFSKLKTYHIKYRDEVIGAVIEQHENPEGFSRSKSLEFAFIDDKKYSFGGLHAFKLASIYKREPVEECKWPNLKKLVEAKEGLSFKIKDEEQNIQLQKFLFAQGVCWDWDSFELRPDKDGYISLWNDGSDYSFVPCSYFDGEYCKEYDLENDCLVEQKICAQCNTVIGGNSCLFNYKFGDKYLFCSSDCYDEYLKEYLKEFKHKRNK